MKIHDSVKKMIYILIVVVAVLLIVTVVFPKEEECVLLSGVDDSWDMGTITDTSTYTIKVKNNYLIGIKSFGVGINTTDEEVQQGEIYIEVYNNAGETILQQHEVCSEIEGNRVVIQADNLKIRGDFSVKIWGENFKDGKYPHLKGTRTTSYDKTYNFLYSSTYKDDNFIQGQAQLVLETILYRAYGAGLLLTILVVLVFIVVGSADTIIKMKNNINERTRIFICYFIGISSFLLYMLASTNYGEICDWIGAWYVLDYGIGIDSRLFIGSIMKLFIYNDFLPKDVAYHFVMACLALLIILISYLMAQVISKTDVNSRVGVVALVLMYIASPASVGYLWNEANMGRLDMYLFILAAMALIIDQWIKIKWIKYVLLSVITISMNAIHQVGIFTYFAVIFFICICNVFNNKYVSIRDFIGSVLVAISTGVSFVYFHFFGKVVFQNENEMINYVASRTDLKFSENAIYLEYFSGQNGLFFNCFSYENYRIGFIIQLFVLWPITVLGLYIIWKILKYCKEQKMRMLRTPYPYLLMFNFIYIPLYVFECDWSRWTAAIITTKFMEIMYLFYIHDPLMEEIVCKIKEFVIKRKIFVAGILIYLASFEKFGSALFLNQTEKLAQLFF